MQNTDEITERLTTATLEELHEELEEADRILRQTHPAFRPSPDRRAEWADYRDQVSAEIASRA